MKLESFFSGWSAFLVAAVVAWSFLGTYSLVVAGVGAAVSIPLASFPRREALIVAAVIAAFLLVFTIAMSAMIGSD